MCGYLSLATKMGLWQKISKLRFGEDFERIHHRWVWPWHMCTFGLWKEPKWMKIVSFLTGVSSSFPDIEFCTRHDLCESSPWPWYFWCPIWENWWQCPFAAQLFGSQRQTAHKACRWRVSQAPNAVWNPSFFWLSFCRAWHTGFCKMVCMPWNVPELVQQAWSCAKRESLQCFWRILWIFATFKIVEAKSLDTGHALNGVHIFLHQSWPISIGR